MGYAFFRAAGALLGLAAIIAQLARSVQNALASSTDYGSHLPTVIANFLSFFTIQSNVLAVVTLAIGAVWAWTKGRDEDTEPRWFAILLACTTTYMLVTGVVYNTLLRNVELPQGVTVPWSNEVLHVVIPLVLLVDLFFAPKRRALPWRAVWIIVAYPIVWVLYTLVRANLIIAPATGNAWWYPYPFLDPNGPGGFRSVVVYVIAIAVGIIVFGFFVIWAGRWRHERVKAEFATM
ncbi:Pr6Pr family membrane protein [Microbacterium sp. DT81.1]|uniref:Pr6Pr family membrane protein n=1 Tax=Microbacterium sp. DT81.1 TaxID=3393413 RepID=UPI003CF02995